MSVCLFCGGSGEVQKHWPLSGMTLFEECFACRGGGHKRKVDPRSDFDRKMAMREAIRAAQDSLERALHKRAVLNHDIEILYTLMLTLDGDISRNEFFVRVDEIVQREANTEEVGT